jgi:hypothetical protein
VHGAHTDSVHVGKVRIRVCECKKGGGRGCWHTFTPDSRSPQRPNTRPPTTTPTVDASPIHDDVVWVYPSGACRKAHEGGSDTPRRSHAAG